MSSNESDGKESYECPECDYSTDTQNGLGKHYAASHDGKLRSTIKCKACGGDFEVVPSRAGRAKCCSKECQKKWQQESGVNSGENSPRWSGGKVTATCEYCGGEYDAKPSNVDNRTFCSYDCKDSWQSENIAGESHHQHTERVDLTCENCGESYKRIPSRSDSRFCSQVCMGEWMSENNIGEDNRAWKGGYEDLYGGGWVASRRAALTRDDYCCQSCGMESDTHRERFGEGLHVHHILPYVEFSDPKRANELTNLVTLCQDCHHNKWEGVPVRPKLTND